MRDNTIFPLSNNSTTSRFPYLLNFLKPNISVLSRRSGFNLSFNYNIVSVSRILAKSVMFTQDFDGKYDRLSNLMAHEMKQIFFSSHLSKARPVITVS